MPILGSFVSSREKMAETLASLPSDIEREPLSSGDNIFDRLEHRKVAGNLVLDSIGI
jgi:hypothetical protein